MPKRVRLALVGVGRWGRNIVNACAFLDDHLDLVAVASNKSVTSKLVSSNCMVYSNWKSMIEGVELDGVIIATPPALHAEIALAALDQGLAVLIEKPLTMDISEANAIRSAAQRTGLPVMVDHIHLYNPAFRKLLSLSNEMGPLKSTVGFAGNRGPYRSDASVLWDWGPHDVAMNLVLMGAKVEKVKAHCLHSSIIEGVKAENIEINMYFHNDIHAQMTLGTSMDRQRLFSAFFENGSLVYDDYGPSKLVRYAPGEQKNMSNVGGTIIECEQKAPLNNVIQEFAEVVSGYRSVDNSIEIGVSVVNLLKQAEENMMCK